MGGETSSRGGVASSVTSKSKRKKTQRNPVTMKAMKRHRRRRGKRKPIVLGEEEVGVVELDALAQSAPNNGDWTARTGRVILDVLARNSTSLFSK